jgi:hypothetical protein
VYLAQAGYDAGNMLKVLGCQDLSLTAARVAVHGALESEDPGWIGAARFFYTMALPTESAGLKNRTATRSLTELQASIRRTRTKPGAGGYVRFARAILSAVSQEEPPS